MNNTLSSSTHTVDMLDLDLHFDDLDIQEVDLFLQDGSKGMPEYAASCCSATSSASAEISDSQSCTCGCRSCVVKENKDTVPTP